MGDKDVPNARNKRRRSTSHSMGWAEYDADLLDNVRKTKRFAVDVSMASDLASKMNVSGVQSPGKSVNRQATSGHTEGMCISSVECSPAITPRTWSLEAVPGAPPQAGWSTPQRPVALGPAASVALGDRLTSPSDPQIDIQDLRKVALRRVALLKGVCMGESGTPMMGGVTPAALEPPQQHLPSGLASPAVSHRRSRLARPQHAQQDAMDSAVRKNGASPPQRARQNNRFGR